MRSRFAVLILGSLALIGCSSTRGGYIDEALDQSLYPAQTKAERLLRYFEVQALLIEFAANSAGSDSERASIAAANAAASYDLVPLINCLQKGAIQQAIDQVNRPANPKYFFDAKLKPTVLPVPDLTDDETPLREGYCSFFDSRMIKYESQLLTLLRAVVRSDVLANDLVKAITGTTTFSFTDFVNILTLAAENYIRDKRILTAFKADARELEILILSKDPSELNVDLKRATIDQVNGANIAIGNTRPERVDLNILEKNLKDLQDPNTRPTIKIWHFYEVYSYMLASCISLNNNAPIEAMGQTRCTQNLDSPATKT